MEEQPAFKDHFSQGAEAYNRYRPSYPLEIFAYLASLCLERDRAWDCGCGGGQATQGLVPHFQAIDATDPSAAQIAGAAPHPRITYKLGAAEASGLPTGAYDLIIAAQAAHWFDFGAFHAEVRRLAKPAGVIALISYHRMRISPEIDRACETFHRQTLAPYWPSERAHVDAGYATIPFPFAEIEAPAFALRAAWPLDHVLGYIGTWSALARCRRECGADPLIPLARTLRGLWGDPATTKEVAWPVNMRVGRVFGGH